MLDDRGFIIYNSVVHIFSTEMLKILYCNVAYPRIVINLPDFPPLFSWVYFSNDVLQLKIPSNFNYWSCSRNRFHCSSLLNSIVPVKMASWINALSHLLTNFSATCRRSIIIWHFHTTLPYDSMVLLSDIILISINYL